MTVREGGSAVKKPQRGYSSGEGEGEREALTGGVLTM